MKEVSRTAGLEKSGTTATADRALYLAVECLAPAQIIDAGAYKSHTDWLHRKLCDNAPRMENRSPSALIDAKKEPSRNLSDFHVALKHAQLVNARYRSSTCFQGTLYRARPQETL